MIFTRQSIFLLLAILAGVIATVAGFDTWDTFWGWAALTATLALASRVP